MRFIFLLFFFVGLTQVRAQDDYIAWTSFQLDHDLSEKTKLGLKPIFRNNNDLSQYQNMSIDLLLKQDLGKGWSTMFLTRSWFIPDGDYRHFLWADIAYATTHKSIKISNRLRYHWALDLNDNQDPDYLRWSARITFRNKKKFQPFFQIEPWYRTEGIYQFQRIRYEPGFSWKLSQRFKLDFLFRIEKFFNVTIERQFNVFVTNLSIKI